MSMTFFDPEDPRLTAYALGELDDPAERAAVETLLEHHPEARQAMKEIQDITQSLTAEYDHERRTALVEAPVDNEPAKPTAPNVMDIVGHLPERRPYWARPWLAAAAVLLLVGIWTAAFWLNHSRRVSAVFAVQKSLHNEATHANDKAAKASTSNFSFTLKDDPAAKLAQLENPLPTPGSPPPATFTSTFSEAPTPAWSPDPMFGLKDNPAEKLARLENPAQFERRFNNNRRVFAFSSWAATHFDYAYSLTDPLPSNQPPVVTGPALDPAPETSPVPRVVVNSTQPPSSEDVGPSGNVSSPTTLGTDVGAAAASPPNPNSATQGFEGSINYGSPISIASAKRTAVAKQGGPATSGSAVSVPAPPPAMPIPAAAPARPLAMTKPTGGALRAEARSGGTSVPSAAKPSKEESFAVNGGLEPLSVARLQSEVARSAQTEKVGQKEVPSAQGVAGPYWTDSESLSRKVATASEGLYWDTPHFQAGDKASAPVADVNQSRDVVANGSRFNTAAYDHLVENTFLAARDNPLSTFSIDVDTASYANVRRFLDSGSLPPPDSVRLEELINYFPYDYAPPTAESEEPFAVHLEAAACPWAPEHRLVRIGIKGKEIAVDKRPPSNLVFLLDVSGSMSPPERLPLIKAALRLLVEQLTGNDHVAIVVYAGNSGLVLPSTDGNHKDTILAALDRLEAGGSTNGASGIALAYKVAKQNFLKEGTNRVILATDGDFNVGVTNQGDLVRLIEREAKGGVFLSALGVGTDNYKDSTMQKLADKGNGNYNYIDRLDEARKVLVEQMSGTLLTIAKDVKIQVEFNPAVVGSYRLIGYEKRMLKKEDFNNDKIDAGEIGAGHSVTALYEVVPVGQPVPGEAPATDALRYADAPKAAPAVPGAPAAAAEPAKPAPPAAAAASSEMLTVKLRHKAPDADTSVRSYEQALIDHGTPDDFAKASLDFKFAAAVAEFGLSLRDSPFKGNATLGAAVEMAQEGKGADPKGYRAGFIDLARKAQALRDAQSNP